MPAINRIFLSLVLLLVAIPVVRLLASKDPGWSEVLMQQAMPEKARAGEVVTITGQALDSSHVLEVHLLDGKNDYRAEIVDQCENTLHLRVPAKIATGRMYLAVKVPRYAMLVEQPVSLTILAPLR